MLNNQYVALNDDIYNSVKDSFEHEVAQALAHLEHIYGVQFNQAEVTFITIHLRGAKRKESAQYLKIVRMNQRSRNLFIRFHTFSTIV